MVDLFQSHPQPPPEPSKVYESNFRIPNFKSSNIFENDLWFLYISRLTSLFASYASKSHNFSFEKMTLCLNYHSPSLLFLWMWSSYNGDRISIQCNSFDQPMLFFWKIWLQLFIDNYFVFFENVYIIIWFWSAIRSKKSSQLEG